MATEEEKKYGHGPMSLDQWKNRWSDSKIGFHKEEVHETLVKLHDTMVNGRTDVKVFFPLCGKAVDMKWLADKGYTIVGVEISEVGIQSFFKESNVEYTTEQKGPYTLYKSTDGKLRLYCGDLFAFNSSYEGKFNAFWDRGSFVAINPSDRKRYSELLIELLADDVRGLLLTFDFKSPTHKGPPHLVPESEVHELFGEKCGLEKLQEIDCMSPRYASWNMEFFNERTHLVTLKSA